MNSIMSIFYNYIKSYPYRDFLFHLINVNTNMFALVREPKTEIETICCCCMNKSSVPQKFTLSIFDMVYTTLC